MEEIRYETFSSISVAPVTTTGKVPIATRSFASMGQWSDLAIVTAGQTGQGATATGASSAMEGPIAIGSGTAAGQGLDRNSRTVTDATVLATGIEASTLSLPSSSWQSSVSVILLPSYDKIPFFCVFSLNGF